MLTSLTVTSYNIENLDTINYDPNDKEWIKTFYGFPWRVRQTNDNGYIISGSASGDAWIMKTDVDGNILWEKRYGESDEDVAFCAIQTNDGGYIITGYRYVWNPNYRSNMWLIKTDSMGNEQWNKTFNKEDHSWGYNILETNDGYIVIGASCPDGPGAKIWMLKTDKNGTLEWDTLLSAGDGTSIINAIDGGYIITGGEYMIKTDEEGTILWAKKFGLGDLSEINEVVPTDDGGYAITGRFYPDISEIFLIKTDINGNKQWMKTFGRNRCDIAYSLIQTSYGGYLIAGTMDNSLTQYINFEAYLVRTNENGDKLWERLYGEGQVVDGKTDSARSVILSSDNGYITTGVTNCLGSTGDTGFLMKRYEPPSKPSLSGQMLGKAGTEYNYTAVANDIDDEDVYYWFDWDDGTNSGWLGPFDSGEEITVSHTWNEGRVYTVSARAKDIHDAESDLATLVVIMPVDLSFSQQSSQSQHIPTQQTTTTSTTTTNK